MNEDELLSYFNTCDKDKSGNVDALELQQSLSNGTWKPFSLDTVRLMMSLFDKSQTGKINFSSFKGLWSYITSWQQVFQAYDSNKSLTLTVTQLSLALKNSGYEVPDEILVKIVSKYSKCKFK